MTQNTDTAVMDLRVGDAFLFDGQVLTVAEPPQAVWGLVEIWVEEWDRPFESMVGSTVPQQRHSANGY